MITRSVQSILTLNFSITAPGTAERLTAYYVPEGFDVVFTNPAGSTGNFYLGSTQAGAESGSRKTLVPGQSMSIPIANTALVWFDADDAGDVLEVVIGDAVSGNTPSS